MASNKRIDGMLFKEMFISGAALLNNNRESVDALNVFPVLDRDGRLAGIVTLDDIRHYLLETSLYDVALVFDIMRTPEAMLKPGDTLGRAIDLFEKHRETEVPVVRDGVYVGFVAKNRVLDRYRYLIENRRELF